MTNPTKRQLRSWLNAYQKGKTTKVAIEREHFGDYASRGTRITRLWNRRLGVDSRNLTKV